MIGRTSSLRDRILELNEPWEEAVPLFFQWAVRPKTKQKGVEWIITDNPRLVRLMQREYEQLKNLYGDCPSVGFYSEKNPNKSTGIRKLFIVATSALMVDATRRGYLPLGNVRKISILDSNFAERGSFDKDLFFLFSKVSRGISSLVLTSEKKKDLEYQSLFRRPKVELFSDWYYAELTRKKRNKENVTMSPKKQSVDLERLKVEIEEICRIIKEDENPEELNQIRKSLRKMIPFGMKSYVTAYLLKGLVSNGNKGSMTSLFVSAGKNRRLYPKDVIGLFTKVEGVTRNNIGEIKILDSYSFISVSEDKAEKIISQLNGFEYRGKNLTINHARKKSSRAFKA